MKIYDQVTKGGTGPTGIIIWLYSEGLDAQVFWPSGIYSKEAIADLKKI